VFVTTAGAGSEPEWNAKCGDRDCLVEEMTTDWELLGVGRDPRVLRLVYESGGCGRDDGWAIATETADAIRIETRQHTVTAIAGEDQVACTSDLRFVHIRARLDSPVRGRRVEGGPRTVHEIWNPGRVPRVVGLSPGDAVHVLGRQNFLARTYGHPNGRVVSQRPRPGTRVQVEGKYVLGTVRLKVKRLPWRPATAAP
jgi:PASTA domain